MSRLQTRRDRRGIRFRQCPKCEGGAYITIRHHSGDPQLETEELCPNRDCINGWVRVTPYDVLEKLRGARQVTIFGRTRMSAGCLYRDLRHIAMEPVTLPDSPAPSIDDLRWAA